MSWVLWDQRWDVSYELAVYLGFYAVVNSMDSLVFDGVSHLQGGVGSLPVVEDLDVFEEDAGQLDAGRLFTEKAIN